MKELFKNDAKSLVDVMFNTKMFNENVTRDNMNSFEELINFYFESRWDTYLKLDKLNKSIEKLK